MKDYIDDVKKYVLYECTEAYRFCKSVKVTKQNVLYTVLATVFLVAFCSSDFFVLYAREVLERGINAKEFWLLTGLNSFAVTGFLLSGREMIKQSNVND